MKCVLYARVSTEEQADLSIPAQVQAMRDFAVRRGWQVVEEFLEPGVSGRSVQQRLALQALLVRCTQEPRIDVVLVHKIDRLARNVLDHATIRFSLQQRGIKLASVVENVDDSISGQLLENIMASIAQFYSGNLGEETKKGMRMKVERGGWPFQPPRGYRVVRDQTGAGHVELDEDQAAPIRFAYEQYATNRFSLRRLRLLLAERGFRATNGKAIPQSGIERMLKNPFYVGRVTWAGVQHKGNHEALVSEELFTRVQQILASRHEDHGEKGRLMFLLRGVARCARCGGKLTAERHQRWAYYRCTRRMLDADTCDAPMSNLATTHERLSDLYRRLILTSDLRSKISASAAVLLSNRTTQRKRKQTSLRAKRAALESREVRLAEAFAAGDLSERAHKAASLRVRAELAEIEHSFDALDADPAVLMERVDRILSIADTIASLANETNPDRQHRFVRAVFTSLQVDQGEIVAYELRSPLDRLLSIDNGSPPRSSPHFEDGQVRAAIETIFEVDAQNWSDFPA